MPPVRVLLANRQSLFREAVRVALSDRRDIEIVCQAADGVEAVAEAERQRPEVAIVDADLEGRSCTRVVRTIIGSVATCRVVVLGDSEHDQRTLIEALQAGASGYLTKDVPLAELTQAILSVRAGEVFVPRRMLGPLLSVLVQHHQERDESLLALSRLTPRECEVLFLLTQGAGNRAIAESLVISPQTARTHIQNVLAKLGVHSRLEATAFVARHGIVDHLADGDGPLLARLAAHRGVASASV